MVTSAVCGSPGHCTTRSAHTEGPWVVWTGWVPTHQGPLVPSVPRVPSNPHPVGRPLGPTSFVKVTQNT